MTHEVLLNTKKNWTVNSPVAICRRHRNDFKIARIYRKSLLHFSCLKQKAYILNIELRTKKYMCKNTSNKLSK
jgi:hypothetical protein